MHLDTDSALDIINAHLKQFRGAILLITEGDLSDTVVSNYVTSRRFFFREANGFATLADDVGLSVPAVREELRAQEFMALTAAGLDDIRFASLVNA
tara:strand:+ start:476 stop:763 length:288 start_codon:yes stop_codon:yes gene_type:complete